MSLNPARASAAIAWILTAGLAVSQNPGNTPPRYEVKRAAAAIQIDGKLTEPAWATAEKMELIFPWESQTGPKQKTTVRVLWDDNFLYAAFECADTAITARFTGHDDPVDREDSVMILINPRPAQNHAYIGLEINPRGTIHDYLSAAGEYFFHQFNLQGVRASTFVDADGWTVEAGIPWNNFDDLSRQHGAGTTWSANFGRWDGSASNRRLSLWSDPMLDKPGPHAPARFGQLVFVK